MTCDALLMVDIARDPRWGRVMEGAGEDPYLGSLIARARVKGFQGKGLGNLDAVMACAKHFAAYGAAIGGRDYNSVDMSNRTLWEIYLPPFKAAVSRCAHRRRRSSRFRVRRKSSGSLGINDAKNGARDVSTKPTAVV